MRVIASRIGSFAVLMALWLWSAAVHAHPHVWITAKAELRFTEGKLVAVGVVWEFDELFGDFVKNEFDVDQDGLFDEKETLAVAKEAFGSLAEVGFLTELRVGDKQEPLGRPFGLEVFLEQGFVRYAFTVPLREPLAPGPRWSLALYDTSSYVDVTLAPEEPVRLTGAPDSCGIDLQPDVKRAAGLFSSAPIAIMVRCGERRS